MSIISQHIEKFDKALDHYKQDIATIKVGRANAAILDNVRVEAYGAKTPLNQVASVSVPEPRMIIVQPWDKTVIKEIEKAIIEADLGLNPSNEGDKIRINIPQMTEETRKNAVKVLNQKTEQARIVVRSVRDEIRDEIMEAEKNKEFGEDEKFRLLEELDKKTGEFNDKIKALSEEKEEEIITI